MRGQMTHLDTDVLAEFRAGLITGRRGARITAHLGGCERCTALDQQLAGVRSLLASVPAPTMPDSVAHRLDTVLAAEVAQRHAAGHAAAQGEAAPADQAERAGGDGIRESPTPRRPGGNRGFQRLALRVLAPAAAVVVLGAGVYGLSHLNLGSSSSSAASSTAGGAAPTAPSVAAGAESAGHVNAPAANPSKAAAVPRGIARAGFSVVAGQRNLTQANLPPRANPDSAATRLRSEAGRRPHGGAGRERPLRGQAGHPRRGPRRRGGHRLDSGPGLLGHLSSCTRHDHALIGNLRALVSVHWRASQMRG